MAFEDLKWHPGEKFIPESEWTRIAWWLVNQGWGIHAEPTNDVVQYVDETLAEQLVHRALYDAVYHAKDPIEAREDFALEVELQAQILDDAAHGLRQMLAKFKEYSLAEAAEEVSGA